MNLNEYQKMVATLSDATALVNLADLSDCSSFRQACRKAWEMRRIKNLTVKALAELGGFTYQHVSDWFNSDDQKKRRQMPAHAIPIFEAIVGNHLLTQWIAFQSGLIVVREEV